MRLLIRHLRTHPEFPVRQDALLCSINDWGRALARHLTGAEHGRYVAPLSGSWEADLWTLTRQATPEAEVWEQLEELD